MTELEYILDVHRREMARADAVVDALLFIISLLIGGVVLLIWGF